MAYTPVSAEFNHPAGQPRPSTYPGSTGSAPVPAAVLPRAGLGGATLDLSIVIPIFNEEETLPLLLDRVSHVLERLDRTFEIIFVDDGSTDSSYTTLMEFQSSDPHVRVIRFRRNFGQTSAISAGFAAAAGAVIITMDGDLQNDPEDIPTLLQHIDEGWDIASGWRADRKDRYLTRTLPSHAANDLISRISGLRLRDHGCTFKAYRADLAKRIQLYGEMHRFIPAAATALGANVIEVPVRHHPRRFGASKYGLGRIFKVFLDLLLLKFLLSYASRPLRVFGLIGMSAFALGMLILIYLSVDKLIIGDPIGGRPLLLLGALLLIFGVQLISMGLLGELLVRIYHETQRKPTYTVRDFLGWPSTSVSGLVPELNNGHHAIGSDEIDADAEVRSSS